jgi:hypothetical protein
MDSEWAGLLRTVHLAERLLAFVSEPLASFVPLELSRWIWLLACRWKDRLLFRSQNGSPEPYP